jgi:TPR repeat protein
LLGLCLALSPLPSSLAFAETAITRVESQANLEAALSAYQNRKYDSALSLGKTAARAGSSDAAVLVGHILRKGESATPNYTEARRWYDMAAAKGHPDALVALGEMGIRQQGGVTSTDAISYLSRAADAGRTDAMRALADMYRMGKGTKTDPKQAQYWLEKAGQSFDFKGMKALGDSLFETDPKAALKAYEKAASAGDIEAAYIAGVMYAENFDIRPDEQKSADWLRIAAEGGHPAAMADYGLLVYQGVATRQSEKEAAAWFQKSAQKGDSEGQFLYAFTLAKGEGVPQNYEDAYYWVLKSIESAKNLEGTDFYEKDRLTLKERLENNINPAIISRAKARAAKD